MDLAMPESYDFDKIESQIKKIETEITILLRQITSESIPNRTEMVRKDYFKQIQEYDILGEDVNIIAKPSSSLEDEPKNTIQFIKSILLNIPEQINERQRYLEKILGYMSGISETDKSVLIQSLLNESAEKIRVALLEILQAFS